MRKLLLSLCLAFIANIVLAAQNIELPSLGDASSSVVSPRTEKQLGQIFLQSYRRQVAALYDPILQEYTESLIKELATFSELSDKSIDVLLIHNPSINAFAVPGGVIGVHTGLFKHARSEDELAAVLAHEIAHLSQRHFARNVQKAKENRIPFLAAMLASLVLASTSGGEAGQAAITATQAAQLDSRLRFSRAFEKEADLIGIQTMAKANRNPDAVPGMFEGLQKLARYQGHRPPEFLLTHPVTENRIAYSRLRADRYPKKNYQDNLEFHLMDARIQAYKDSNPQISINYFKDTASDPKVNKIANQYGLAVAYQRAGQQVKALKIINALLANDKERLTYRLAEAETLSKLGQHQNAINALGALVSEYPAHHAAVMTYAEILNAAQLHKRAANILEKHAKRRPRDPDVWFLLAEARGLSDDIIGVHRARAEYFIMSGLLDEAEKQLTYALKLTKGNFYLSSQIEQRQVDIDRIRERRENAKI